MRLIDPIKQLDHHHPILMGHDNAAGTVRGPCQLIEIVGRAVDMTDQVAQMQRVEFDPCRRTSDMERGQPHEARRLEAARFRSRPHCLLLERPKADVDHARWRFI